MESKGNEEDVKEPSGQAGGATHDAQVGVAG